MPLFVITGLLVTVLALVAGVAAQPTIAAPRAAAPRQPSMWPASWTLLETDPVDAGCDAHRDVINAYSAVDSSFLYFRLENVDPAGWPSTSPPGDARYKWWLDTAGSAMSLVGTNITGAEYVAMVEDLTLNSADPTMTRDQLGEMTLLDDLANIGFTTRWDSTTPPKYTTNTPSGLPSPSTVWRRVLGAGTAGAGGPQGIMTDPFIGFRVTGANIDMYVSRARIGNPGDVCALWATDNQDNNLDQAPSCDHSPSSCLQVITPTPTPTNTPTNTPTDTPTPTPTNTPTNTPTFTPTPTPTNTPTNTPTFTPSPTRPPTGIRLSGMAAMRQPGGGVEVTWQTASEADVLGFDVWRAASGAGPFTRINAELIPATGSAAAGARYSLLDEDAPTGPVVYRVDALDAGGHVVESEAIAVAAERVLKPVYLPMVVRPGTPFRR